MPIPAIKCSMILNYIAPETYAVEVWESDFTSGNPTWQGDFAVEGVTLEHARAYFRAIDVAYQERLMINERDIDSILLWLDVNGRAW